MKRIAIVLMAAIMLACVGCAADKNNNMAQQTPVTTARPTEGISSEMPQNSANNSQDVGDVLETVMPELVPSEGTGEFGPNGEAGQNTAAPSASTAPSAQNTNGTSK